MYSPFLKSKRSEGLALQRLAPDVRESIFPLIDLAAPTTEKQKKNPAAHVKNIVKDLSRYLNLFERVMVDSSEMDANIRTPDGVHPILAATRALDSENVSVVPMTGLDRDQDHLKAVTDAIKEVGGSAVGIRIDPYDLETPTATARRLEDMLSKRFGELQFVLVYDLRTVFGADINTLTSRVLVLDEKVSHDSEELTIVSGSGLPQRIVEAVPTKSSNYIARVERQIWSELRKSISKGRTVVFGDYATVTPDYVELDFALIYKQMGPKVIYALDEEWFVTRGGSFERHPDGRNQYYSLAKEVIRLEDFPGEDYCFGDGFIGEKAKHIGTPGSPASWVIASINRHISRTARNPP